ncbi:uncharacterized protein LOC132699434 isoform X2 [Cylas formicarius]|uniref:uncharacterized protein LOC132699434 isoform X2 n=1 Tax=Cylas formicarius TaxID=197179 RepID=UPI002958B552|nr:uncharacterized protein LOC132699434 isoform X2 [Cylas formicarius]
MGKYRGKLRWITDKDLGALWKNNVLKSPEILELYRQARGFEPDPRTKVEAVEEILTANNISEMTEDILVSGKTTSFQQLVDSSGIDKLAQEEIYREFLLGCYPSLFMSLRAFTKFIMHLGWSKEQAPFLFRSADLNNRYGLSFRDFLYFLAAIDPNTSHGGAAAELRCRFYDRDVDGLLKYDELKNLLTDLRQSKNQPLDLQSIAKDMQDTYKSMGIVDNRTINVNDFLRAVCDLKIRGTSQIFRSPIGVIKYLREISEKAATTVTKTAVGNYRFSESPSRMITAGLKSVDYEIAVHTIKIRRSGHAINVDEIREIQGAISATTLKQPLNEHSKRQSLDVFSQRSLSNELLKGVRYLTTINNVNEATTAYSWGQLDPTHFARNLIQICGQLKEIFWNEPRLLEISSPVYIMGDLHGNVADLLYFEKVLWHMGPGLSPGNLLFLGDYVDRGLYSIEVIAYLFSYKIQNPHKVSLLRGNHEIREVQKLFTFFRECCLKFGEKLGNAVWGAINGAFDAMPLAAVVDGKIFCCHGGVPPPWLCPLVSAINDIPAILSDPDTQSPLAWELMWNDPVRLDAVTDKLAMELLANEGFAINSRRGTAHVFSVEALERFLKTNQLTHLIRAHQMVLAGFQVQQKGKLLTVFSSSKYAGGQNDAACIMADQGKLRILRLETE